MLRHLNLIFRIACFLALIGCLPATALAFDHLEITVVNPHIVAGRPAVTVQVAFSARVRAVNADGTTDLTADFINAELYSPDVPANLPPHDYLHNGERQFDGITFLAAGQPVRLRVRDADDASVPHAEVLIDCYNPVDHFLLTVPAGDKFVDQAVNVTLVATDYQSQTVANFGDDVILDALVGDFSGGPTVTVPGTSFAMGQATLPVIFWGTNPVTRENTLTARNTITYPGQAGPATGSVVVSPLRPGPLATVVLLLPGESLNPGVSPGKTGVPQPQISGNSFNGVDVYATDQHWNPVESGPYPTLSWSSDDPSPGVSLPAGGAMASNAELDEAVTLIQSGLRRVTVSASGPISSSNESNVIVNPEGLDHFVFDYSVWDTLDVQVTTIPFQLRVRAQDSNNNPFPYNGQVTLRARLGTSDESEDYLITNNATFVNGQLDALVQVTKRAFSARVIVDSNADVVGVSGHFQVNSGPLNRILLTFPGETWVPGLNDPNFSGNMGVPNSVVAGQIVDPVTVRPVDRYGNIVSGQRNVTISCGTGYFELPDYPTNLISLNNPVDVRVIFRTYLNQTLTADASGVNPNNSSAVYVSPAPFARMVVAAPGEQLEPGIFDSIEDDGKIGDPSTQDAGVPFQVRVYATDSYWNPITDVDPRLPLSVDFSSSDAAAVLPANPQQLADNTTDFSVTLITLADPNQQTIRVDDNGSAVFAYTTIPLKAGAIDHFDIGINNRTNPTPGDVLAPIPDHQAGSSLPNVTIVARDIFNNHIADYADSVSLYVNHGTNVLTPVRVSLGDGFGTGTYHGVWRGSIRITRAGQNVRLFVREDLFAKTDSSNAFTVFAGTYEDLVLLLPGETHTPGIAPGKVGTPLPVVAGNPVVATVIATDSEWNPIAAQPTVHFGSSSYFQMISANDQQLDPNGTGTFDLYFKAAQTQQLSVRDLIAPAKTDTSTILVTPGSVDRLMILLPGETPLPGGPEADGKVGAPLTQTASLEFDVHVRSVDQFWNLVDNSSEHIHLASDDGSITPTNPLNNDQSLVNGEIILPLFLTSTGFVTLAASALDHTDIVGQAVTVEVEQGAMYQITTPPTAFVGPPSTFSMTIALVDSNGAPLPAANNWVTISALLSNLEPASSAPFVTQAQLNAGSVTINNQAYDTVEDIVLRIGDASGRLSYSSTIQMQSNGMEYVVAVTTTPTPRVGPPATFPVNVRLRDVDTQTVIDDDRRITVDVRDVVTGTALGAVGVTSQRLDRGTINFQQSYTRAGNVYVTVTDSTGLAGSSPIFGLVSDGYKKLQIVAPGEVVEAGIPIYATTGKSGTAVSQRSGEPFPITVRAVDQYWNLADTTNSGVVRLVASDNSFSLPGNPAENYVPFVNGRRTFNGFLTDEGIVTVSAFDEADISRPSQSVPIPVDPPFIYEITVPATASTGPVPGFQVTVKLIDPVTGNVVPTAMNRFTLTPLLPNQGAANGTLGITQSQLVGGVSVINHESYSTVEDIVIRVTDDFGREAISSVIHMDTGGLYYAVTIPDSATVGPPATFPLRIELIDSNTGERVTTQDRLFAIEVMSATTGLVGTGQLEVRQGLLVSGLRNIAQAYTKAEDIFIEVSDTVGVVGISNTCRMLADGFKRIQIVAPGETPQPGAVTGTGKIGEVLTQQAEVPFTVTVRAVDQYFNLMHSLNSGTIHLSSSGGALDIVDPVDQDAPFINGSRDIEIVLGDPGLVALFATDPQHPTVNTGRVDIPVNEAEYRIILPTPPQVVAGPPATFTLTIRLVNPETEERINAGNAFTMTALHPDRTPASSALGIGGATLVAGEAIIGGQYYATSEQIVIRVSDARGREAFSEVLTVVPVGVRYAVDVPDTVVAGESWSMSVRRVDIVTGQLVTNDDRTFLLRALSGNSPRPDLSLRPMGVLADTVGTTALGVKTFDHQSYDRAETIYLRVSDDSGELAFSDVITVLPAAVSSLELWAERLPGQRLATPVRPGQIVTALARATDASGNAIIGEPVQFRVLAGDGVLGAAHQTTYSTQTASDGLAMVSLTVTQYGSTDILLEAAASLVSSVQLLVDVIGPPRTVVRFDPEAPPFGDGYYVTSSTRISLTATTEESQGIQAIFFDVDQVDPPYPGQVYTGDFSLAQLGLDTPGDHRLRFYAEEVSGVAESVRTVTLHTGRDLDTDRDITNRPNPFRAGHENTLILFRAPRSGTVTVTIYDLYGDVVHSHQEYAQAGELTQFVWDGRNGNDRVVANGGYICRIHGNGIDLRRKIAVIK